MTFKFLTNLKVFQANVNNPSLQNSNQQVLGITHQPTPPIVFKRYQVFYHLVSTQIKCQPTVIFSAFKQKNKDQVFENFSSLTKKFCNEALFQQTIFVQRTSHLQNVLYAILMSIILLQQLEIYPKKQTKAKQKNQHMQRHLFPYLQYIKIYKKYFLKYRKPFKLPFALL
ncbi:hypothetical protein TTHERM_001262899 (macronuclear) [Tetrahymena thermophila SB210]|uniref:Uncharacterized protein n=1 Tax=Tetrahymena thermophila (strain SB210) TaxID=312017 RepID=W7X1F8_TETTS|nr:hypothetical protein TTHERM_001262899 [Tetrahymena thermophila SB210]EWS71437.1 hypothetical protein TTHERM_001262899 [Tetrahymena thermophila SB210]|eukprot:XP_012656031.1 hypothetical protein TTHERM_001262899 [Tetrahymena thermophila SB210]